MEHCVLAMSRNMEPRWSENLQFSSLFSICTFVRREKKKTEKQETSTVCLLFRQIKGCEMGPRHVLVSPCFRENVVATCKIGSFLCSLDN